MSVARPGPVGREGELAVLDDQIGAAADAGLDKPDEGEHAENHQRRQDQSDDREAVTGLGEEAEGHQGAGHRRQVDG